MRRILYFDCTGGVSGDMMLGALVDLGVSFKSLVNELDKLGVDGFHLKRRKATRGGIQGTRIRVEIPNDRHQRSFKDFQKIINQSRLSAAVKERSYLLIKRIFAAEARVHGKSVEKIHLHELGSLDTLVDVVGAVIGVSLLDVSEIVSSPINIGSGTVKTEHGLMTVPAPATVRLLKNAQVFSDDDGFERTTPTGALLVTGLAHRFGPWPGMCLKKIGYGVGTKNLKHGRANALRVALGESVARTRERVVVMKTTIDDMSPELTGYLVERLLEEGVLDVYLTPVQMKKNRPGVELTVITDAAGRERASDVVFAESTTLGLRSYEVERDVLKRRWAIVKTAYGKVRIKEGLLDGTVINWAAEYDDCRKLASRLGVSIKRVQQAALVAYGDAAGQPRKKGN